MRKSEDNAFVRVAFFGSSAFSCLVFEALQDSAHEIAAVITQPDQPAGRRMTICPTPMCTDAQGMGVPVLKPERVKSNPRFRAELMEHRPDAFIVASYGQIISRKVLALTEWPLNVHPSALPKLRGASPVRTALLNGLRHTECCIMRMTPRLDDGDVMLREPLAIPLDWNHGQLETTLGELGGRLAVAALDCVVAGTAVFTPQNHDLSTSCSLYRREDTVIDWTRPAGELADFIRAWDPEIGALTTLPDGRRLKIWKVSPEDPPELAGVGAVEPGSVLAVSKKSLWVDTGSGSLRIDELQPNSKARMPVASFLAGNRLIPGERLGAQ